MNLPEAFLKKMQHILKNENDTFIDSFTQPRTFGLRLNPKKVTSIENNPFLSLLTPNPLVEYGYYYDPITSPGRHPYHHAGVYYIQDPSAMMVIENADIQMGDIVFDMSAAPGGKSTQILSKLNGTGLLIANEINPKRAKILSENIERMGYGNVVVLSIDPLKIPHEFDGFFDKVIVDAPCSGEGMFRKDQDAVEQWTEELVNDCSILQKNLLDIAHRLVKNQGFILYSTCTFSTEEDEGVIQATLTVHPDCLLLPTIKTPQIDDGISSDYQSFKFCSRFYFHHFNGEGHFIAKLQKTNSSILYPKTKSKSLKKASKDQIKWFTLFLNQTLNAFVIQHEIYDFNQNLYVLMSEVTLPNLDTISLLRYGLHLGEIKKDRFEPSHSFALFLQPKQVQHVVNFTSDSEEVIQYLCGEVIPYPGHNQFTLITVDDFPLGWAKHVNNTLKNYYPKGLRIMR